MWHPICDFFKDNEVVCDQQPNQAAKADAIYETTEDHNIIAGVDICRKDDCSDAIKFAIQNQAAKADAGKLVPVQVPSRWDMYDQMYKINGEYKEAWDEIDKIADKHGIDFNRTELKEKQKLAIELIDIQVACETALAILGLDEKQRDAVRDQVNEKNRSRGYME